MAGEWLKFDCTLPDKPETLALTALMAWDDPDLTVGKLMRLFRWFDLHTLDGNAAGVTPALLDRVIGVPGFVHAVEKVGWLELQGDGLSLKNFNRHNGATAKSRALTAKRVANHRANGSNDETVTPPLAREEKKKEEKKEEAKTARKRGPSHKTPLPEGFAISEAVRSWAREKGHVNVEAHLESFIRKCQAKGYAYVDWDKAFMNAIAEDWGKVREQASKGFAVIPPQVARATANRPTPLEELQRDAVRAGLTRGLEESTVQFRHRIDEVLSQHSRSH